VSNSAEARWRQRLENFRKALTQLDKACEKESYTDLERAGLVQMFEFTYELAWKTLKDMLFYEGFDVKTPRAVIRKSFEVEYLNESDAEALLDGIEKRNLLSHTYEEQTAAEAVRLIKDSYTPVLRRVFATLKRKQSE
jgi:nucleotidyltransferase substrate binding protein (TIGR01987 family)